jgi:hypothetical protein
MPGAQCTRSLACEIKQSTRASSPQVHQVHPAFPHAMVLTVSFVLSPAIGLFVTVVCASSRRLDAGVEASEPHDFAVHLKRRSSYSAISVHRIPPRVRDDRETPLCGTGR